MNLKKKVTPIPNSSNNVEKGLRTKTGRKKKSNDIATISKKKLFIKF
jgi:hypothetical protein